ncbi:hypothetical protein GCM10023318_37520 [Nocardia callitridis]|uniref:Uncharacterized protein n=1 Tax=Nocardia callitridis TaxID=648753 RepID=A0ABP9KIT5_9NOCA
MAVTNREAVQEPGPNGGSVQWAANVFQGARGALVVRKSGGAGPRRSPGQSGAVWFPGAMVLGGLRVPGVTQQGAQCARIRVSVWWVVRGAWQSARVSAQA